MWGTHGTTRYIYIYILLAISVGNAWYYQVYITCNQCGERVVLEISVFSRGTIGGSTFLATQFPHGENYVKAQVRYWTYHTGKRLTDRQPKLRHVTKTICIAGIY